MNASWGSSPRKNFLNSSEKVPKVYFYEFQVTLYIPFCDSSQDPEICLIALFRLSDFIFS